MHVLSKASHSFFAIVWSRVALNSLPGEKMTMQKTARAAYREVVKLNGRFDSRTPGDLTPARSSVEDYYGLIPFSKNRAYRYPAIHRITRRKGRIRYPAYLRLTTLERADNSSFSSAFVLVLMEISKTISRTAQIPTHPRHHRSVVRSERWTRHSFVHQFDLFHRCQC
jgi:hypothetical protein